jgi:hypothetical protein
MRLIIGQITFEAPDTTSLDDFIKWIDSLLLRSDKLSAFAVSVMTGTASTTSAAAATPTVSTPSSVQVV